MELACHIRNLNQLDRLAKVAEHLKTFYPPDGPGPEPCWPQSLTTACNRIYVGDEFCVARMPTLLELQRLWAMTVKTGHDLTLLTPVMTDKNIEAVAPLFGYLDENLPATEVVFNDWGVMAYVSRHFSSLKLSAGRLLNKGFKDPRLKPPPPLEDYAHPSHDMLLNWSTYDGPWIREQLLTMNIDRCEQDLLPYRTDPAVGGDGLAVSVYFPFGYVTSGRICWTASFDQPAGKRFMPTDRCSRPCGELMLELKSTQFAFRIFQSGNTIFFLYPGDRLESLLQTPGTRGLRLVYQGFGFEAS